MWVCMNVWIYMFQHFQTLSPLKPLGRLKPNFIRSLHGMGERKFVQMEPVTWTIWPQYPYLVKTLKHLLWKKKADDLEIVVSSTRVKPISNDDPGVTLTFLRQGQICSLMPLHGNTLKQYISKKILNVYDMKVGTKSQLNEYMTIYEYPRSRSFIDLCPRSLRFHRFQTFLSYPTEPMWCLHGKGKLKFVQMVEITWPRWPPCPYMVKTFKIFFLWTLWPLKSSFLEPFDL